MGLRSVKRKGFFHILEVVIVAMMIFVVLTQLYSVPKANQPWDAAKLNVMSEDLLYSLDAKGVNWFSQTEVNRTLYNTLPGTMGYAVSTTQDVRPSMKIGLVCTGTDLTEINSMLQNFPLNGIQRRFTVTPIAPGNLDLSPGGAHSGNDAIVFCNSPGLNDAQISNAERYLSGGGGIVEFSDLSAAVVQDSRWYDEVINLQWTDSVNPAPSARARFPYMDPDERRYPVQKIFFGIPTIPATPPATFTFANFGDAAETVYPADNAAEKIVVIQESYYIGGSFHDGKEVPLSTIDWGVNGSGRVAWMSRAVITGSADQQNNGKLLKSLIVWAASGKSYPIVEGTVSTGATSSMRKVYQTASNGMYEPVRIDLTIGYHF
jgi:hypothetical protein